MTCGINIQPGPQTIYTKQGTPAPTGWIEQARFKFDCQDAIVLWPEGSTPATVKPYITASNAVINNFVRDGVGYIELLWRQTGSFYVSQSVSAALAISGGGGSGGSTSNLNTGQGGGGAAYPVVAPAVLMQQGNYSLSIGAGGPGTVAASRGNNGSNSVLTTPSGSITSVGGGGGGGSGGAAGLSGGCGGGGGGSAGTGGAGQGGGFAGGASNTEGGGGGGAGGIGGSGADNVSAGNGGQGITIDFGSVPRYVCGGGGGSGSSTGSSGSATHGGSAGVMSGRSENGDWGAGSGGAAGTDVNSGNGGNGFMILVVRSDDVTVIEYTAPQLIQSGVINGILNVGQTLTYTPAVYSGNPQPIPQWRWQTLAGEGSPFVTIQTGGDLVITPDMAGNRIRTQDRAYNSVGMTAWSNTQLIGPIE